MIIEKLIDELDSAAEKFFPEHFKEYEKIMNRCCFSICVYVVKYFELFANIGDFETLDSVKKKTGIGSDKEYILKNIFFVLIEEKMLETKNDEYFCINIFDIESPSELLVLMTRNFPEEADTFQWLARALGGIIDILKNRVYPEDIMFPWSNFELIENFYNSSSIYEYYSKLGGFAVKKVVEKYFNCNITLLEIGAGTGNGTEYVFKNIKDRFEKYIFTDISKSLVKRSSKKFAKYSFIEYKLLDISKDLTSQGFDKKVDILYAVNVLHATPDILIALRNCLKLLKKGGVLILSELAPPEDSIFRFMEFTFGLLPRYYNYKDKNLRQLTPLVSQEKWGEIFKTAGFSDTGTFPDCRIEGIDRGGIVIGIK